MPGGQILQAARRKSGHDEPVTKITRGEEEDISDEEMMKRWGKPEEEEE